MRFKKWPTLKVWATCSTNQHRNFMKRSAHLPLVDFGENENGCPYFIYECKVKNRSRFEGIVKGEMEAAGLTELEFVWKEVGQC